ncbi:hypothetical protein GE09DRAFT_504165 [Coniochaeta sp. 2T2.1]|nr:hypothetical protein GE09DRAFT_504165 [Coniochaeta sp. 2T2.1]
MTDALTQHSRIAPSHSHTSRQDSNQTHGRQTTETSGQLMLRLQPCDISGVATFWAHEGVGGARTATAHISPVSPIFTALIWRYRYLIRPPKRPRVASLSSTPVRVISPPLHSTSLAMTHTFVHAFSNEIHKSRQPSDSIKSKKLCRGLCKICDSVGKKNAFLLRSFQNESLRRLSGNQQRFAVRCHGTTVDNNRAGEERKGWTVA